MKIDINSDIGDAPKWIEHPTFGCKVDVVAIKIPLGELLANATINFMLESPTLEPRYEPSIMDEVFVIGYPWGLTSGDRVLPLFKRGSIASEPIINNRGLPRFFIDSRTAPAMSGSPVLVMHRGVWSPSGEFDGDTRIGTVENFAGVYSGRLESGELDSSCVDDKVTEIGIVWKKTCLEEIVLNGVCGAGFGSG